jgi:S-adenosylmethionine hydrolase
MRLEVELGGRRHPAVAARTFGDGAPGETILYEDSYRNVSVAISRGNAAESFAARPGQPVRIRLARS